MLWHLANTRCVQWVCCAIYVTGEHRFVWQMCCDLHESCAMNYIFMSQVCYDLCDRCAVTGVL